VFIFPDSVQVLVLNDPVNDKRCFHLLILIVFLPTIIIKQGKIDERAMRSQRYNFDDLLMQLRENNISIFPCFIIMVGFPSSSCRIFWLLSEIKARLT
jgi:hypothetical protein